MKLNKITGIWFLIGLLLFAITPKDFIHEFHDHEHEIEHIDLDCHSNHFEIKHSHCPLLKQVLPIHFLGIAFLKSVDTFFFASYTCCDTTFLALPIRFMFGLKAPPAGV